MGLGEEDGSTEGEGVTVQDNRTSPGQSMVGPGHVSHVPPSYTENQ